MKLPIPKGLSGRLIRTLSLTLALFTLLAAFGCSDIRPMATVTGDSAEYDTPPEKSDYPVRTNIAEITDLITAQQ